MTSLLYSTVGLSFWGGIDPEIGNIIDHTHPLHGKSVKNKVLCIPTGRGSCTGSQVMLELILNGCGPRSIILRDPDAILCTGAVIAQEFFGDECPFIPTICAIGKQDFENLKKYADGDLVVSCLEGGKVHIESLDKSFSCMTADLLKLDDTIELNEEDERLICDDSEVNKMCLRTIKRVASISGAKELIPITSGHIDAVTYIGQGGLRFVQRLVEMGGKVSVPTTLNSQSVDRRRWKALGVDDSYAKNANAIGDSYLKLGCEDSFTCAPYLLPKQPQFNDQIVWGESNAVVYSNSVIGARTEKYADYFDICCAILGRVPLHGVHITRNRRPNVIIDASKFIDNFIMPKLGIEDGEDLDSFFPLMGWVCGKLSDGEIPLILGFDKITVTNDNLKGFSAAFGTTGTAPLFHMAKITPEAKDKDTVNALKQSCLQNRLEIQMNHIETAINALDSGRDRQRQCEIDLVALGNPHLSVSELKSLSELIRSDNRPKHKDVKVMATLSRHVLEEGSSHAKILENWGVQFINDTCWCMLLDPPIIPNYKENSTSNVYKAILTNSGKYAHYGPALTNRRLRFASMKDCIESAKSGRLERASPRWLQSNIRSFSSLARRLFIKK